MTRSWDTTGDPNSPDWGLNPVTDPGHMHTAATSIIRNSGDYAGYYLEPDVVCAEATGTPATDTANLQAAIDNCPAGGTVFVKGHYKVDAALTIPQSMTLLGDGIAVVTGQASSGGDPSNGVAPWLSGTIIEQTVAATDGIDITGSGVSVHLKSFGILFSSGLASTGHGVNATTTATYGGYPDLGCVSYTWEDIYVHGHDGNHYAFVRTNCLLGTTRNLRSYGGGGFYTECNHYTINSGNDVNIHPYASLTNSGTAGGYVQKSRTNGGNGGFLNLLTFVRPQVMAGSVSQRAWDDLSGTGIPQNITAIAPDLEGTTGGIRIAPTTLFVNRYVTTSPTNEVYTDRSETLALAGSNYLATSGVSGLGTYAFNNGEARFTPIFIPREVTLTSIGVEVTTAGSTGSVLRFGVYNSDVETGEPTILLLDAGTAVATTVGAVQVTGLSQTLQPGLYWFCAVGQGAPTTNPTVRYISTGNTPVAYAFFPTGSTAAVMQTWVLTGVTGALTPSPTWSGPTSQTPPYVIAGYNG